MFHFVDAKLYNRHVSHLDQTVSVSCLLSPIQQFQIHRRLISVLWHCCWHYEGQILVFYKLHFNRTWRPECWSVPGKMGWNPLKVSHTLVFTYGWIHVLQQQQQGRNGSFDWTLLVLLAGQVSGCHNSCSECSAVWQWSCKKLGAGCSDCFINPAWLRKAPGSPQRASGCSFGRKLGKDSSKHGEVDGCGGSIALQHIKPQIPKQTFPWSNKYIVLRKVLFKMRFTADRFLPASPGTCGSAQQQDLLRCGLISDHLALSSPPSQSDCAKSV